MLTVLKPQAEKVLQPIASLLKNINPNTLSALGLLFPVLFYVFLVNEMYVLALITFIFNAVDMLDGMVARATNKVTAFGGFLDSTIDRFADFVVIAAFGFAGIVSWGVLLPLIMFTYLVSYMRSRTELAALSNGVTLTASVGMIERTERLVAIFIGLLAYALIPSVTIWGFNVMEILCLVLIILSIVTVYQRTIYAYQKLK